MYKLLIVDDEPNIIDGLMMLFSKYDKYELDIIKALSAEEAAKILSETKIDLLITDIKMGNMSGLELADIANEMWEDCRIIFLTGYNNFNYVYEAINKKNVRYMLKTECDSTLIRMVTASLDELTQDIENKMLVEYAKNIQQDMETTVNMLKQEFYSNLLSGVTRTDEQIGNMLKSIGSQLHPSKPVLIVCSKAEKNLLMINKIEDIVRSFLGGSFLFDYFIIDKTTVLWMFQPVALYPDESEKNKMQCQQAKMVIKGNLETIQNKCKAVLNVNLTFILGNKFIPLLNLHDEYILVCNVLNDIDNPCDHILIIDAGEYTQTEQGDMPRTHNIIRKINTFIRNNIDSELSLTKIAAAVYFNPSYLSRFYKAATGKNIIEYISEVRLEIAKSLLANTQLKINQISLKTGFTSPSYFTAFFKKSTGLSPKEYRDSFYKPV